MSESKEPFIVKLEGTDYVLDIVPYEHREPGELFREYERVVGLPFMRLPEPLPGAEIDMKIVEARVRHSIETGEEFNSGGIAPTNLPPDCIA